MHFRQGARGAGIPKRRHRACSPLKGSCVVTTQNGVAGQEPSLTAIV